MPSYKDALKNSEQIASKKDNPALTKKREVAAQVLGADPKDINDKNMEGIHDAAKGAAIVASQGGDPTKVPYEGLRAAHDPEALKKDKPEDLGRQKLLFQSIIGILPTVIGLAAGGDEGGAIGAKVGQQGVADVEKYYSDQESKQLAAQKLAQERADKEREFGLKEKEIDRKLSEDKLQAERLNESQDIRRDALDLRRQQMGQAKSVAKSDEYRVGSGLRGEYMGNPTTKRTMEVADAYQRMNAVARQGTAASDMSLIYSYMKIVDPGSTVREGEFANAQQAAGVPEQILNLYNKALKGTRLTDAQRNDFLKQAQNMYSGQLKSQSQLEGQYRNLSQNYGVDSKNVIYQFQNPNAPAQAPGGGDIEKMKAELRAKGFK